MSSRKVSTKVAKAAKTTETGSKFISWAHNLSNDNLLKRKLVTLPKEDSIIFPPYISKFQTIYPSRGHSQRAIKQFIHIHYPSIYKWNPEVDISYHRLGPQYWGGKPIISLRLLNNEHSWFLTELDWTTDQIRYKLLAHLKELTEDPLHQLTIQTGYSNALAKGHDIYNSMFPPPPHLKIKTVTNDPE